MPYACILPSIRETRPNIITRYPIAPESLLYCQQLFQIGSPISRHNGDQIVYYFSFYPY